MPINLAVEVPVSIADASAIIPGTPHVATVWRWTLRGVKGARLESFIRGGRRFTTHEAIERFIRATTAAADSRSAASLPPSLHASITPSDRRQEIAAEERFCEANGI
jgi:hypothetical protein